jgi:hypothetical protein
MGCISLFILVSGLDVAELLALCIDPLPAVKAFSTHWLRNNGSHLWCGLFGKETNLLSLAGIELSADSMTAVYRVSRHGIDLPDAYRLTIDLTRWRYHCLFDMQVSRSICNSNNKHWRTGVSIRIHFVFYILCFTSIRTWNMRTYHYSIV